MTYAVTTTIHLENIIQQETNNKILRKNSSFTFKNTLADYSLLTEEIKSVIIEKIKHEFYRLTSM